MEITDFVREYSARPVNGTYELLGRIGGGGMGTVFRVRHLIFGAQYVLKVMKPELGDSEQSQRRFLREALLSRKVQHPRVAAVVDAARLPDGSLYIISELIEGVPLADAIARAGRLPAERCLGLASQILDGLEAIHGAGLVHRDISPDNIMVSPDPAGGERATIIDLGIAREISHSSLTTEQVFIGKYRYASPEQLRNERGQPIDGRADLYSFGIVTLRDAGRERPVRCDRLAPSTQHPALD